MSALARHRVSGTLVVGPAMLLATMCSTSSGQLAGGASDAGYDGSADGAGPNRADADADGCVVPASCSDLLAKRASLVGDYRAAEASGDLAGLPAIGTCVAAVVAAERASPELCGVPDCERVCVLHDCPGLAQSECVARCNNESSSLGAAQMDAIVHSAAMTPLCTCDICAQDTFPFCEAVWGCQSG